MEKVSPGTEGPHRTSTAADLMKEGFAGFSEDGSSSASDDGRVGSDDMRDDERDGWIYI